MQDIQDGTVFMSKICVHCGNVLKDDAYFCIECGGLLEDPVQKSPRISPFDTEESTTVRPPVRRRNPSGRQQKNIQKLLQENWKLIAGGAAALIALVTALIAVIALLIALFSGGPKTAVKNLEKVMNGKEKTLEKMAPQEYWDYREEDGNFTFEDIKADWKRVTENWNNEDQYGKKIKTSIKINEKTKVSKDKLESIAEAMEQQYGIKASKVKKAYILDTTVTVKGKEDSRELETKLITVKIGSKWYFIDYYEYGNEVYVSFNLYLKS